MSDAPTIFYYDGDCGMCAAFVRRVAQLDRRRRVTWTPYQSLQTTPSPSTGMPATPSNSVAPQTAPSPFTGEGWDGGEPPAITRADMERSAYAISPDGAVSEGFFAIRALFEAIPALAPLGWLMSIPGASLIGRPLYRLVADNRRRISRSCRVEPTDPNATTRDSGEARQA